MGNELEIAETDKAWLAGVIEGDGSIGMGFHQTKRVSGKRSFAAKPTIQFSNQDMKLVERVSCLLEALVGKMPRLKDERSGFPNGRGITSVYLTGTESVNTALKALIPYFVGDKLAKARLLQRFTESRLVSRHEKSFGGVSMYTQDELVLIREFYEETGPRKGGKRNPVIGVILRDHTRDPAETMGKT